MFKAIVLFLTAAAQALLERERNHRLRLLTENARELYAAQAHLYKLADAAVTGTEYDLAQLRVSALQAFDKELSTSGSKIADNAPHIPPKAEPVDPV